MYLAGWEVDYVEIDLSKTCPVATIKCHRADGRWLWARVDSRGRCTMETFHRETRVGKPREGKGRWPQSPQIDDVFLGRVRPQGARALLRQMTNYIAENALHPVGVAPIRKAWASAMSAQTGGLFYTTDPGMHLPVL